MTDKADSATLTLLIAELRKREATGRQKYGTDVDRKDLTAGQWHQHLREELMDALLYSLRAEQEAAQEAEDAARYRWLRDECGFDEYRAITGSIGPGMLPYGPALDAAIDLARSTP